MTKIMSTEIGTLTADYALTERTEDGITQYGIAVRLAETGEEAIVEGISPNREAVEALLEAVSEGGVTPVTLLDVVYDFISEI